MSNPKAVFAVILAITEAIRDAKEIPSGTLYAALMSKGCTLEQYNAILDKIIGTGLVERTPAHLLRWIGPEVA